MLRQPLSTFAVPLAVPRTALLAGWGYVGGTRDERLDLLRGFAVFAMVVDHIGGNTSWLYAITGGDHFVISAAEVFVLIAGLTMGMVYARQIASRGAATAVQRALRRAGTLYALTVALTVAFAAVSALLGTPWAPVMPAGGWPRWVLDVATLQRTFYLTDILLLYAIVIAAAAPVFALLARGHTHAALLGSWAVWGAWQLAPGRVQIPWPIADNDMFSIAAWQVIFVTGIVIGFHRRTIESRLTRFDALPVAIASGTVAAVVLVALLLPAHPAGTPGIGGLDVSDLGRKSDVPLARLVMLGLFFTFAYAASTVIWRPLLQSTRWLMPLGQNALLAYIAHLAVVVGLDAVLPTWDVARGAGETAVIQSVGVLFVWSVVMFEQPARDLVAAVSAAIATRPVEARPTERPIELAAERSE